VVKVAGLLLIVFSFLLNVYFIGDKIKNQAKDFYTVTRVVDGDSFFVNTGAEIRLLGVDAPELGRCGSQEAKDTLEKLIANKKIKVSPTANDSFNRLVADVYLDGKSVNNLAIVSGWVAYDSSDSVNSEQMKASGENARENKIGIYSEKCSQLTPPDIKCNLKANFDDVRNNKFYYTPGCYRYAGIVVDLWRGDQWFCSEKEAQAAGFTKAKVCP
jgi:endonuclease YncB( thermonuclease family)